MQREISSMKTIHKDCFFYKGSSPCGYHKVKGVVCDGCSYYKPIKIRIVIVKLGELGDVLRTTSILRLSILNIQIQP